MTRGPSVIVVVGPTASGKSDFAVELARSYTLNKEPFIDGEIVSADSRQVYKGLDIGTGKITEEEMRGVPHYMLSTYSLDDQISVARYAHDALPHIEDIIARGKTQLQMEEIHTPQGESERPHLRTLATHDHVMHEDLSLHIHKTKYLTRLPHRVYAFAHVPTNDYESLRSVVCRDRVVEAVGPAGTARILLCASWSTLRATRSRHEECRSFF
jgi:hypothetical protein